MAAPSSSVPMEVDTASMQMQKQQAEMQFNNEMQKYKEEMQLLQNNRRQLEEEKRRQEIKVKKLLKDAEDLAKLEAEREIHARIMKEERRTKKDARELALSLKSARQADDASLEAKIQSVKSLLNMNKAFKQETVAADILGTIRTAEGKRAKTVVAPAPVITPPPSRAPVAEIIVRGKSGSERRQFVLAKDVEDAVYYWGTRVGEESVAVADSGFNLEHLENPAALWAHVNKNAKYYFEYIWHDWQAQMEFHDISTGEDIDSAEFGGHD